MTTTPSPRWNLVYNPDMESGNIAMVWDCYLGKPGLTKSQRKLFVMKIITRINSNDTVNQMTIDLQIKLGKLGIMPEIIDQGIQPAEKGDPATFKRRFFVMTKYMTDGSEYLEKLKQNKHDRTSQIRRYYSSVFDLYQRLASHGVCSFDAKNRNIVLNYDRATLDITDIRVIDIDYSMATVLTDVESCDLVQVMQLYAAAVLMHYITDRFTHCETYPTYDCYRNIIPKINFDYLVDLRFDLIEDSVEYKTGTYIGLFYCYYGICETDLVKFSKVKNPIELFTSVFEEIVKVFPFIEDTRVTCVVRKDGDEDCKETVY